MAVALVFLAGGALLVGALRSWRPQPGWRAAAAYVALVAALFAPVIFGGRLQTPLDIARAFPPWLEGAAKDAPSPQSPSTVDGLLQMYPFRALVRERLLHGELPFWAHELGTGQPLLADGQSAPFAPLNLMALPLPAIEEQSVLGPWKILVALLLMHALLAALGARAVAAAFGAVAFALTPYTIAWLNHPHTAVSIWLPGVLLGVFGLARAATGSDRRRAFSGLLVCGLAAALGGHPETLAHVALAAGVAVLVLAWQARARRGSVFADVAVAAAAIGLLASPVLLPLLDAIPGSQRAVAVARSPLAAQPPEFRAQLLETLVQPDAFGNPISQSWRGSGNFNELSTAYAGLLVLGFALAAGALDRRLALILLLALIALAIAFHAWPFWDLWYRIPELGRSANGRLRMLWVFGTSLIGALALERLSSRAPDREPATDRARLAISLSLLAVLAAAATLPPVSSDAVPRFAWAAALASVVAALAALAVPRWRPQLATVCFLGLLAELALPAARFQPAVDRGETLLPPAEVGSLAPAPDGEPFRTLASGGALPPNLGALAGIWDPRGNDPMRPARATSVLSARLGWRVDRPPQSVPARRLSDESFLEVLGVRYLLVPHGVRLHGAWMPRSRWGALRVWENPSAGRIFFVAPAVRRLLPDALVAGGAKEDLRRLTLRAGTPADDVEQDGHVDGVSWSANAFTVRISASTPVLVASSVSFDRGWRASIDGAPVSTEEVNAGFLGFSAPAGDHLATLRYRPRGWIAACWLALLGAALAGAWLVLLRDRERPA